jgi:outer membrane protein
VKPAWLMAIALGVAGPLRAQAPAGEPLTLFRAIELAQGDGLAGRAAASALEGSRWRTREFRSRFLPKVMLGGQLPSLFRRIEPVVQPDGTVRLIARAQTEASLSLTATQELPFTGGQLYFATSLSRLDLSAADDDIRYWQSSPLVLGLRQDLFRLNTLAWDSREQKLSSEVAEREYVEAREDVALATVSAFFDAFRARATLDNLVSNAAINDTLFRLNRGRFEIGRIGENDLLQSELALLRARNAAEGARLDHDRSLAALRLQLGLAPGSRVEIAPPAAIPDLTVDTAVAVVAAQRNRSAGPGNRRQELQARRRVREAKLESGFGATVAAELGYNQTAATLGDAYRDPLAQQSFSVGVELPLLQWGAGKARVGAARAEQDRLAHTTRLEEERAAQEAYFTALELDRSRRQVELAAKADTVAAKRFEVAMNRYVIGKIGVDNLFVAQTEKDGALQEYLEAVQRYWTTYYRLRRLTLYDFAAGRSLTRADG